MSRNDANNAHTLQQEIRKQFGSVATTRFVRSLPAFRVENSMPERFANLLAELDRTESDKTARD